MISKARAKFIKSLQLKKYRVASQAFLVEGTKSVLEVLESDFVVSELFATTEFLEKYASSVARAKIIEAASLNELSAAGTFRTNDGALAVVDTKPNTRWKLDNGYGIMLDDINDPGNFGTIIRIADWYGIKGIVASNNVPDLYNPKVIGASKGSFTRVPVYYTSLPEFIATQDLPAFGADLNGADVHSFGYPGSGWIVMGSEAHGISSDVERLLTEKITIPSYGKAESLNVGMATAIICDNLRRSISD